MSQKAKFVIVLKIQMESSNYYIGQSLNDRWWNQHGRFKLTSVGFVWT